MGPGLVTSQRCPSLIHVCKHAVPILDDQFYNEFCTVFYRCRCRWKNKKRHRYSLLKEIDDDQDDMEMLPKGSLI